MRSPSFIQPNLKELRLSQNRKKKIFFNQIRIQNLVLQIIRTNILTQGDYSFGSKNIKNHEGQADGYATNTTPTLLPLSLPSLLHYLMGP